MRARDLVAGSPEVAFVGKKYGYLSFICFLFIEGGGDRLDKWEIETIFLHASFIFHTLRGCIFRNEI